MVLFLLFVWGGGGGGNAQMEILIATLLINKQLGNLVINFIMETSLHGCLVQQRILFPVVS